ncbi:uncharacterized protein LOC144631473 [Oculina patagonica]
MVIQVHEESRAIRNHILQQNIPRPCMSARGHLVQQDTGPCGVHSPVGGIAYRPAYLQNIPRPCIYARGHLVQQDTGPCGVHSPVGGIAYQPGYLQVSGYKGKL